MPIGHALMVVNALFLNEYKFIGAFLIGLLGVICLYIGIRKNNNQSVATISGFLAAILIWTGWVEFSFVWSAENLKVQPLIENNETVTKPEYLVMMSSFGLLLSILIYFVFSFNNCQFFNAIQKLFKINFKNATITNKYLAKTTFIETIVILWTFYLVLLFVYDKQFAGDKHPATYIVAFGSLFWSIYLITRLIKITKLDYAIRYAIPTVIIFWNFIEIIGRWNMFFEIWVHPFEYWIENITILFLLFAFLAYYIIQSKKTIKKTDKYYD